VAVVHPEGGGLTNARQGNFFMKDQPRSVLALALAGTLLMGLGLYFGLMRPPLLPEDLRYIGSSIEEIRVALPGLLPWLRQVFWVMGGFIFTTGLLSVYLACTALRARTRGVAGIVALAGAASIGSMAVVNFLIDSDFKWLIMAFGVPWGVALALYWIERNHA
jgi:hypothetical protein